MLTKCIIALSACIVFSQAVIADGNNTHHKTPHNTPHNTHHGNGDHMHETLAVDNFAKIPDLKISVTKDAKSGWNLQVIAKNFRFSPEHANTAPIEGEGHAHLYINNVKTRLYGNWYYISTLPKGKNTVRVTLNANNHADLTRNGKLIEAVQIIDVQ